MRCGSNCFVWVVSVFGFDWRVIPRRRAVARVEHFEERSGGVARERCSARNAKHAMDIAGLRSVKRVGAAASGAADVPRNVWPFFRASRSTVSTKSEVIGVVGVHRRHPQSCDWSLISGRSENDVHVIVSVEKKIKVGAKQHVIISFPRHTAHCCHGSTRDTCSGCPAVAMQRVVSSLVVMASAMFGTFAVRRTRLCTRNPTDRALLVRTRLRRPRPR